MPVGTIREPTEEERARLAAGPRYDPKKPKAPWGERGRREERKARLYPWGGVEEVSLVGVTEEPFVPWQPFPSRWAVTGGGTPEMEFPPQPFGVRPRGWRPEWEYGLEPVVPYPEIPFWTAPAYQAMREAYRYEQSQAGQMVATMRQEKPVPIPAGIEDWSSDEQLAWANENALASRFIDDAGNIISFQEAERMMGEEPERVITQVWYLGGEATIDSPFYAADLYNVGFGGAAGTYPGGRAGYVKQKYDPPELLAMKQGILTSNMSYSEKLKAMLELIPGSGATEVYRRIKAEVLASLSPEELEEVRAEAEPRGEVATAKLEAPKPEVEAPIDIAELGRSIAPYGVNLIQNYPYISPIAEALLRRIPTNILEMMARYLESKGLSWRDYLELGRVYAGTAPARATWEPARQW